MSPWSYPISVNAPALNLPLAFDGSNIVTLTSNLRLIAVANVSFGGAVIPAKGTFVTTQIHPPGNPVIDTGNDLIFVSPAFQVQSDPNWGSGVLACWGELPSTSYISIAITNSSDADITLPAAGTGVIGNSFRYMIIGP